MRHSTWTEMFETLKRWSQREQKLPGTNVHVPSGSGWLPLGLWLADQRVRLQDGTADRQQQRPNLQAWILRFDEVARVEQRT